MKKKKGFTLVEILGVIVVLSVLLVITVPKILEVIEKAEREAYKESVELMAHTARLQYQTGEVTDGVSKIPDGGIIYEFENGEYKTSNILNFKGDKPFSGTITLTKDKKVIIEKLVSKNKKWCAIKEVGEKHVRVGKATDPEFACIIEPDAPIEDKKPCEMEIGTELIDGEEKEIYYIDSPSDLYALSQSVDSGNTYSGKIIKVRNNLDMSTAKGECVTDFNPIGNSNNKFSGTFDGGGKTISNLEINKPDQEYVGLFGYIDGANIMELFTNNITINGKKFVGTIGYANNSDIKVILNEKTKIISNDGSYSYAGGLLGYASNTNLYEAVIKEVEVTGYKYVGSIAGTSDSSNINNILVKSGKVTAKYNSGFSGYFYPNNSIIENLEFNISSSWYAGWDRTQFYASSDVLVNGEKYETNSFNSASIGDISFYEAAGLDTWIGGDSNSTGYYFDITSSGEVDLVSVKDKPIPETPNLSGSGTKSDPYIISNANDWKQMASLPNIGAYYKINNNIDFTNEKFYMLGSRNYVFNGHIDGNGKTISNVNIIPNKEGYLGLISNMSSGSVNNLYLNNIKIYGGTKDDDIDGYVGVFGKVSNSNVKELFTNNTDIRGSHYIGTIGMSENNNISVVILENCYIKSNTADSTQSGLYSYAGGLIGYSFGSTIINEILADNVTVEANGKFVGLILGCGSSNSNKNALNILIKSGSVINTDKNDYTGMIDGYWGVNSTIIENLTVTTPILRSSGSSWTLYYSNNVIVNGANVTDGFDPAYVGDLDYYADIVETLYNGDLNNTGYFFDYVPEKNGIYLVKAYTPIESSTPAEKTGCKIEYGNRQQGCYLYNSGVHGNYLYEAASSEDTETGGACTGTSGRLPAYRTQIIYNCS